MDDDQESSIILYKTKHRSKRSKRSKRTKRTKRSRKTRKTRKTRRTRHTKRSRHRRQRKQKKGARRRRSGTGSRSSGPPIRATNILSGKVPPIPPIHPIPSGTAKVQKPPPPPHVQTQIEPTPPTVHTSPPSPPQQSQPQSQSHQKTQQQSTTESTENEDLGRTWSKDELDAFVKNQKSLFSWFDNSCHIDSTLTLLLLMKGDYFRGKILGTPENQLNLSTDKQTCEPLQIVRKIRKDARSLLSSSDNFQCVDTRSAMAPCTNDPARFIKHQDEPNETLDVLFKIFNIAPSFIESKQWISSGNNVEFQIVEFELQPHTFQPYWYISTPPLEIIELFDDNDKSIAIAALNNWNEWSELHGKTPNDLMDSYLNRNTEGGGELFQKVKERASKEKDTQKIEIYDWNSYQGEVLIFNSTKPIHIARDYYSRLDQITVPHNWFMESTINFEINAGGQSWELMGAILWSGDFSKNFLTMGSSGHFTSVIKLFNNEWVLYNDIKGGSLTKLGKDEKNVKDLLFSWSPKNPKEGEPLTAAVVWIYLPK